MKLLKSLLRKTSPGLAGNADFWNWFLNNESCFYKKICKEGGIPQTVFNEISDQLEELNDGLWLLATMRNENCIELIFTADGIVKNIVFAEELVKEAPQLKNWKFTALKQPSPANRSRLTLENFVFDETTMSFFATEHTSMPDEIDITITHKDLNTENREIVTIGVFLALDLILGELRTVATIDNLTVIHPSETNEALIPLHKLNGFLRWREAEFIEKYEDDRHHSNNNHFDCFEAITEQGQPIIARFNTQLLNCDRKASHPWISVIKVDYKDSQANGLPTAGTYTFLGELDNRIFEKLCATEDHLYIGKQTGDSSREIYVASSDFRLPSKVLHQIRKEFDEKADITFDIYKDKYWQSFHDLILC